MVYSDHEAKKYRPKYRCSLAMVKSFSCPHKQDYYLSNEYDNICYMKSKDYL